MLYFFLFPFADAIDNVRFFLSRTSFFLFFLSLLLSMCLLLCPRMAPHGLQPCGRSAHNNSSSQAFPSQNSFFPHFFSSSTRSVSLADSFLLLLLLEASLHRFQPFLGGFFFFLFFLFSLVYQLDACRAVSFYSLNVFLCP